jgi:hypothetical protein
MQSLDVLESIGVASPCEVPWEQMSGTDQVRWCGQCRQKVYNLSAMSREEAVAFVEGHQGKVCVRFFRRKDGTILTADCARPRRDWFWDFSWKDLLAPAALVAAVAGVSAVLTSDRSGKPNQGAMISTSCSMTSGS